MDIKSKFARTVETKLSCNVNVAHNNNAIRSVSSSNEHDGNEDPFSKLPTSVADVQQMAAHSPTPEQNVTPTIVFEGTHTETPGAEEEKGENTKVDRATLIEQYEKKVEDFFNVPENVQDVKNKIYNRPLVQLLHEIIKVKGFI